MTSFWDVPCELKCTAAQSICNQAASTPASVPYWEEQCRENWVECFSSCVPNSREALYATTPTLSPSRVADMLRWKF